jgi:hypothetical protein
MADTYGKDLIVKIGATAFSGQQDGGVSIKGTPIEAYGKADFPNVKRVVGWVDWTMNCTMLCDIANAAYIAARNAALAGTLVVGHVVVLTDDYTGDAQITGFDAKGAKDGMVEVSVELTGLGALTV